MTRNQLFVCFRLIIVSLREAEWRLQTGAPVQIKARGAICTAQEGKGQECNSERSLHTEFYFKLFRSAKA